MFWLLHALGIDDTSGHWYGFWSGFGSDLGELAIVGGLVTVVRQRIQHHKASMAQAQHHHAQLTAHHNALLHMHERHHTRMLDAVAAAAPPAPLPQRTRKGPI